MKWIVDNWSLLVVIIAFVVSVISVVNHFVKLPTEEQEKKVKEAMLLWVAMAEKEFGKSTGVLKLRYVYNLFVERYPALVSVVPFEVFASWVDEVLDYFKRLMETNDAINEYVEGKNGESE